MTDQENWLVKLLRPETRRFVSPIAGSIILLIVGVILFRDAYALLGIPLGGLAGWASHNYASHFDPPEWRELPEQNKKPNGE